MIVPTLGFDFRDVFGFWSWLSHRDMEKHTMELLPTTSFKLFNEKQLKAMRIFQTVQKLILNLFKAHHGKQLEAAGANAGGGEESDRALRLTTGRRACGRDGGGRPRRG